MQVIADTIVKPLPDDALIEDRERKWRIKLPESYRSFLKSSNGGALENGEFSIPNVNRVFLIERFLCLLDDYENPASEYDIRVVLSQIELRLTDNMDLLGVEKLPIAAIFGGDMLCLDFKGNKDNPSVCVWLHDESGEFQPETILVADSFTHFCGQLD